MSQGQRQRLLLLCPNEWDADQLPRSRDRWANTYEVLPYGEGAEHAPATFDALAFVDDTVRRFRHQGLAGVTSSSDYPGCLVAAAVAQALELPGPTPEAVLRCSHKYYSRQRQAEAVPEATPAFALLDPDDLAACPLPFPFFVKPVKSWFSQHARRIASPEELHQFVSDPAVRSHLTGFVAPFNQLLHRYTDFAHDGGYLLAEECLTGVQVTVEGYSHRGRVEIVGVVDSVMYPGTISFQRFDYPSHLPAEVQARMADIAARVIPHTGLDEALFNIEMFYDADRDRIAIIEINPRMCGQFADLYELVNGTNTYEILFALATGRTPPGWQGGQATPTPATARQSNERETLATSAGRHEEAPETGVEPHGGRFGVAASFALREFGDRIVRHTPDAETVAAVQRDYPVTLVQTFYHEGQRLSDEDQSDGYSYRYGIINLAAPDHATLLTTFEEVKHRLGYVLEPV